MTQAMAHHLTTVHIQNQPLARTLWISILLRFCIHRVAVIADLEKAFLMVSVAKEGCDAFEVPMGRQHQYTATKTGHHALHTGVCKPAPA